MHGPCKRRLPYMCLLRGIYNSRGFNFSLPVVFCEKHYVGGRLRREETEMADHERDAGLLEMEPSPVEETPVNSKEGYFPPSVSTSALRPSAVGLSQHSAVWYLSRIEKYSTYVFTGE